MIINRQAQRKASRLIATPVLDSPTWSCSSEACINLLPRSWPLRVYTGNPSDPIIARLTDCPACGKQRPLNADEEERANDSTLKDRIRVKSLRLAAQFDGQTMTDEITAELNLYARRLALMYDPANGVPWIHFAVTLIYRWWTPHRVMEKLNTIDHQSRTLRDYHEHRIPARNDGRCTLKSDKAVDFANIPASEPVDDEPAITPEGCRRWMDAAELDVTERTVIVKLNGLDGEPPMTRKDLQKQLRKTFRELKVIERSACDKLRKTDPPLE